MKKNITRTIFFMIFLGAAALPPCFAQNMFVAGGEFNLYKNPRFQDGYAGFNLQLHNEHIQNDFLLSFGYITSAILQEEETKSRFMFRFKDNIYVSYDCKFIGFRAGVSASLGIYDVPQFPSDWDLFFNIAGLAGICILPKAFISVTVDALPGYALTFRFTNTPDAFMNDSGFMLPVSVGLRINLDKL